MKTEQHQRSPLDADDLPQGYKESPRPKSGRFVFGPWCLLGTWPAIFGVMEKIEEQEKQ